jgi:hypothetical protein
VNESEGIEDDQVSFQSNSLLYSVAVLTFESDTVVVFTVNYADYGSEGVFLLTPSAHYEKSKFLGSGKSLRLQIAISR